MCGCLVGFEYLEHLRVANGVEVVFELGDVSIEEVVLVEGYVSSSDHLVSLGVPHSVDVGAFVSYEVSYLRVGIEFQQAVLFLEGVRSYGVGAASIVAEVVHLGLPYRELVAGGATFGFYAGMLYSFPMFYAMHLLFNGYTSELAWLNTVYQVIVYVIVGATAGALNKARPATSR